MSIRMKLESGEDQDVKVHRPVLTRVTRLGLNMSVDAGAQKKKVQYALSTSQKTNIILLCKYEAAKESRRLVCAWLVAPANSVWLGRRHAFIYSSTFWELAMRDKVNTLFQACRVHMQTCTHTPTRGKERPTDTRKSFLGFKMKERQEHTPVKQVSTLLTHTHTQVA